MIKVFPVLFGRVTTQAHCVSSAKSKGGMERDLSMDTIPSCPNREEKAMEGGARFRGAVGSFGGMIHNPSGVGSSGRSLLLSWPMSWAESWETSKARFVGDSATFPLTESPSAAGQEVKRSTKLTFECRFKQYADNLVVVREIEINVFRKQGCGFHESNSSCSILLEWVR